MKKITFILAVLMAFAITSIAQYSTAPINGSNGGRTYSQMWNIGNTYYNTANTNSKLGTQIDTGTNTTVMSLSIAKMLPYVSGAKSPYPQNSANLDTFIYTPLNGTGIISFTYSLLKCTNSPTVTVTPMQSFDGNIWTAIPGVTVATVSPTSLTVPVTGAFTLSTKYAPYYRLDYAGSSSSTYSAQSWFNFCPNFNWNGSKP